MKGTMKTAFISMIFLFGSAICQWSIEPRQKIEPRENSGKVICTYMYIMAIRVVEFSNGVYKTRKIFVYESA